MEKIENPYVATVNVNKKDYMSLSIYNLKRFLGLKEVILYAILLVAALVLFFVLDIWLFLLLFAVVNVLIVISLAVFLGTSMVGFKYEFVKTGVKTQKLTFQGDEIIVENFDGEGKIVFEETHPAEGVDKIGLTKDRIYIFRSTAVYYYIKREDVADNRFFELQEYLKSVYPPNTFRLKKKLKMYPGYNNKEK